MLQLPQEKLRLPDRNIIANFETMLRIAADILKTSKAVHRKQTELDRKPGKRNYSVIVLILCLFYKEILKLRYDDVRYLMFGSICEAIGLPKRKDGTYMKPRGSTLCESQRDILVPLIDELTKEIAEGMLAHLKIVHRGEGYIVFTLDSTPIQASRYNYDALFNGHYMIRMDKMHIIMADGMPLFMILTDGVEGDTTPVGDLLTKTEEAISDVGLGDLEIKAMADGGYDSFNCYSQFYRHLGVQLDCHIRENAKFHEDATWEAVQRKYSRMYRCPGFDPYRKNDEDFVLSFLLRNGKDELVGKYIRNKQLEAQKKREESGVKDTDRQVCETVHHSMKSWFDFTTLKLRHDLRYDTIKCRFFFTQLVSVIFKGYVSYD